VTTRRAPAPSTPPAGGPPRPGTPPAGGPAGKASETVRRYPLAVGGAAAAVVVVLLALRSRSRSGGDPSQPGYDGPVYRGASGTYDSTTLDLVSSIGTLLEGFRREQMLTNTPDQSLQAAYEARMRELERRLNMGAGQLMPPKVFRPRPTPRTPQPAGSDFIRRPGRRLPVGAQRHADVPRGVPAPSTPRRPSLTPRPAVRWSG
jgi:hypothetical protein